MIRVIENTISGDGPARVVTEVDFGFSLDVIGDQPGLEIQIPLDKAQALVAALQASIAAASP